MVGDARIEETLRLNRDPQDAADRLVEAANEAGGLDNITAIVIDVVQAPAGKSPSRRRRLRLAVVMFIAAFILVVGGAAGAFYLYAQSKAYLVLEGDSIVLYRGLTGDLSGLDFSWFEGSAPIDASKLLPTTREDLDKGKQYDSLQEAKDYMQRFAEEGQPEAAAGGGRGVLWQAEGRP
jgi:protein phosphatase